MRLPTQNDNNHFINGVKELCGLVGLHDVGVTFNMDPCSDAYIITLSVIKDKRSYCRNIRIEGSSVRLWRGPYLHDLIIDAAKDLMAQMSQPTIIKKITINMGITLRQAEQHHLNLCDQQLIWVSRYLDLCVHESVNH